VPSERFTVAVLAPFLNLTITVERAGDTGHDEIHIHPGGQGFWISRMLRQLGERPLLCAPVGGETGRALRGLIGEWGIDLSPVSIESRSPSYVHDRRSGERTTIAEDPPPALGRHEMDDLYGRFLDHAMAAGVCVVTGQPGEVIDNDAYRRLGTDLASAEVRVVGDLHGEALSAFLEGGPIRMLKVSEEDLREDGELTRDEEPEVIDMTSRLREAGAIDVVVSRSKEPAIASLGGRLYRVTPPLLEPADHRGAGDSMTAALTRSLVRSAGPEETLRLAAAAGAANVTRHGLGTASKDLIDELAKKVELTVLDEQVVK
jgi:1-phosphofructokinase